MERLRIRRMNTCIRERAYSGSTLDSSASKRFKCLARSNWRGCRQGASMAVVHSNGKRWQRGKGPRNTIDGAKPVHLHLRLW